MYFFGLSKEEVLSKGNVVSYKETFNQNQTSTTVTLFGRQVYPVKRESSNLSNGCMRIQDIDLRLPADHYACTNFDEILGSDKVYSIGGSRTTVEMNFPSALEANEEKEALATSWSGKRNPKIVIDLEQLPTSEDEDSISYVTVRSPETKPSFLADQSLLEDGRDMESGLLDLNSTPLADELVSEPHYCFLQDLNCPYIEETETSCDKTGIDDGPSPLCSPKSLSEKDGTTSPASDTSCCTTEDNLRRRGSSPREPDPSCRTRLEFPGLPENERCNEEEEEMAAESLVHISAVSYQNQDLESKPVSRTNSLEYWSCDSYELHTLGISETNTEEDLCVSSMARDELNNITRDSSKETGLKLRRGRRMKHFQKEILPNLTSLSRHEIREDINILEAVLRSREYKKMQGKTKDVVKLGANLKNKRSVSQRYVGKIRRKHE
ncbi:T284 protein [Hirschfeldia incana]|nr:T284 protein [Hirschfeldia incana]KAJ0256890.1 T284 protein [Hirschfeldia incana]